MKEKEKETMERVITKADDPKVAEAAAIFATGYAAGMAVREDNSEKTDKEEKPA